MSLSKRREALKAKKIRNWRPEDLIAIYESAQAKVALMSDDERASIKRTLDWIRQDAETEADREEE